MKPIGVLALQGNWNRHCTLLTELQYRWHLVRAPQELAECGGLIIPGGESTVMAHLMQRSGLLAAVHNAPELPIFGICAGTILLANTVRGASPPVIGGMDIIVARNAYGRQIHSHCMPIRWCGSMVHPLEAHSNTEGLFIRAPKIVRWGNGVQPLAYTGEELVAAQQGRRVVATFHPEMSGCTRLHLYFCKTIMGAD